MVASATRAATLGGPIPAQGGGWQTTRPSDAGHAPVAEADCPRTASAASRRRPPEASEERAERGVPRGEKAHAEVPAGGAGEKKKRRVSKADAKTDAKVEGRMTGRGPIRSPRSRTRSRHAGSAFRETTAGIHQGRDARSRRKIAAAEKAGARRAKAAEKAAKRAVAEKEAAAAAHSAVSSAFRLFTPASVATYAPCRLRLGSPLLVAERDRRTLEITLLGAKLAVLGRLNEASVAVSDAR